MAALFTTPKRNDTTAGTHVAEPDVRRRIGLAHGSWRRVTRRIVAGAVCALTVSSLLTPSVSLAAEWVKVGGNKYNTAASDEAGTWSWDGADDLKLNNYNGSEIQAAGKPLLDGGNGRKILIRTGKIPIQQLHLPKEQTPRLPSLLPMPFDSISRFPPAVQGRLHSLCLSLIHISEPTRH